MRPCPHPAWIEIDSPQLEDNFRLIQQEMPGRLGLLSVIKDDAYGHGAVAVAKSALRCGIHSFGLSTLEEAVALQGNVERIPRALHSTRHELMRNVGQLGSFADAYKPHVEATCNPSGRWAAVALHDLPADALITRRRSLLHLFGPDRGASCDSRGDTWRRFDRARCRERHVDDRRGRRVPHDRG